VKNIYLKIRITTFKFVYVFVCLSICDFVLPITGGIHDLLTFMKNYLDVIKIMTPLVVLFHN